MNELQRLPIGIQDFEKLRTLDAIYVDKTEHMAPLFEGGTFFLSRPRRFGKSLLLSTLKAAFEGKKELFAGLWLENNHNFEPRPVIRIDFSQLDLMENQLEKSLLQSFQYTAADYGFELKLDSPKAAFEELIRELSKRAKVVILIDEYDKAITEYLEDDARNSAIRLEHQKILRSIYGLLKPMDAYLYLVVLTGVSKIGKLNLFSDLNSLQDISLVPEFAKLCGYSREEIIQAFPQWLERAWTRLGLLENEFWDIVKYWYNGYSWDGENRLYCPFSFLLFLSNPSLKGYWYATGTPTFLIKLIEQEKLNPLEFEHLLTGEETLSTFDLEHFDPVAIMFQTGYLTIKSQQEHLDGISYQLSYPNHEVRQAFSRQLLERYANQTGSFISSLGFKIRNALVALEWETFFTGVKAIYASIPNIITSKEKHFHALFHVLMCAVGFPIYSELLTNKGRMDTLINTRAFYVIFEFKTSGSAEEALEQIDRKDYAEQFAVQAPVYKVGVVFDENSRNIKSWKVAQG